MYTQPNVMKSYNRSHYDGQTKIPLVKKYNFQFDSFTQTCKEIPDQWVHYAATPPGDVSRIPIAGSRGSDFVKNRSIFVKTPKLELTTA